MKLHWYLFSQLALAFVIAAAGMIFIALPGLAVGAVHKLGSVGMLAVLKYLPMVVAGFVPYVVPVSLLLSLVSTYGKLAANNEWTAIRMAGINPYRMLLPAFALAVAAGAGVYYMNAELLPWINIRSKTIRIEELKNVFKNLSPGQTDLSLRDFYLKSTLRDPLDPNIFYDCYIEFPRRGQDEPESFTAEAVRFEFDAVEMRAYLYNAEGTTGNVDWAAPGNPVISVNLEKLTDSDRRHSFDSPRYQTSGQILERLRAEKLRALWFYWHHQVASTVTCVVNLSPRYMMSRAPRVPDRNELHEKMLRNLLYAWHHRMANAVTCLMFVLVGVSTGVLMRKGTQLAALAVAVSYALVYWIFSLRLGEQLTESEVLSPWLGAWGPLALFCGLGAWLTHRAFRE